jgi:hypothetical protein
MSQVEQKFIKFGIGAKETNSRLIPAHFTPTNYIPAQIASEGNDKTSAHLKGIDDKFATVAALPSGDINPTNFSGANNQSSPANVTGLSFSGKNHFMARIIIRVDATADLFESYELIGTKKSADWDLSQECSGDDTGVVFSITSGGQVQYTSPNFSGFVSLNMDFRAEAL